MNDQGLVDGIVQVARDHLHLDPAAPVTLETEIVEAWGLDSVRQLTLIVQLENFFEVCFEEGDEADLVTVADLVALIRRRKALPPPA